jgi:hypothetical protein
MGRRGSTWDCRGTLDLG